MSLYPILGHIRHEMAQSRLRAGSESKYLASELAQSGARVGSELTPSSAKVVPE